MELFVAAHLIQMNRVFCVCAQPGLQMATHASLKIKFMISLIVYALAVLTLACWILGWCLWHAYLAFSRFFTTHNHKRPD